LLAALVLCAALSTSASATQVRQVAQLPVAAHAAEVEQASSDGRWLLVETATDDDMTDTSLWSVDTVGRVSSTLTKNPAMVSQAPDGAFAGWVAQACSRPARIHLVAAGQSAGGTSLGLPGRYVRSSVVAMTVSSSGRVTVLVSDGPKCYERGASAVLSAARGATRFTQVVRTTRDAAGPSVAPDGRVVALCFGIGATKGANPRLGKLVVVNTEPEFVVSTATESYYENPGVDCAASDRGTATMTVVQRVSTAGGSGPNDFRTAGVTVGDGHARRFALKGGTGGSGIGGVSPSGRQIIVEFDHGRAPVAVRVRDGRSRTLPRSLANVTLQSTLTTPAGSGAAKPLLGWNPFADAITANELAAHDNRLRTLDIVSGRWRAPLHLPRQGNARICFLPTGRVLVAAGTFASGAETPRVYRSDGTGSRFVPTDTRSLGTVFSISCESAPDRVYVTTADSGRVFEIDAGAVDDSAFSVLALR
jgi:hypothetical protein